MNVYNTEINYCIEAQSTVCLSSGPLKSVLLQDVNCKKLINRSWLFCRIQLWLANFLRLTTCDSIVEQAFRRICERIFFLQYIGRNKNFIA